MHKNIVVFEIEGGSDKYFDGHRKDTMPIVNAIREAGWSAEVVYYRPEWKDDLYDYVSQNFDGYISRVNPGNIPGGERGYFELLTSLSVAGLVGMSTPGEMMAYGAKDALVKLKDTDLVPSDTAAYYDVEAFHSTFPTSLSYGERVLKQNRGSTGSGIWRVRIADEEVAKNVEPGTPLPLNTKLKCTEAVDNHTETRELGEFMDFCDQYIIGDNGMLVDMRRASPKAKFAFCWSVRTRSSWFTRSRPRAAMLSRQPCSPVRSTPTTSRKNGRTSSTCLLRLARSLPRTSVATISR